MKTTIHTNRQWTNYNVRSV